MPQRTNNTETMTPFNQILTIVDEVSQEGGSNSVQELFNSIEIAITKKLKKLVSKEEKEQLKAAKAAEKEQLKATKAAEKKQHNMRRQKVLNNKIRSGTVPFKATLVYVPPKYEKPGDMFPSEQSKVFGFPGMLESELKCTLLPKELRSKYCPEEPLDVDPYSKEYQAWLAGSSDEVLDESKGQSLECAKWKRWAKKNYDVYIEAPTCIVEETIRMVCENATRRRLAAIDELKEIPCGPPN